MASFEFWKKYKYISASRRVSCAHFYWLPALPEITWPLRYFSTRIGGQRLLLLLTYHPNPKSTLTSTRRRIRPNFNPTVTVYSLSALRSLTATPPQISSNWKGKKEVIEIKQSLVVGLDEALIRRQPSTVRTHTPFS
jgi:hypothetical protein